MSSTSQLSVMFFLQTALILGACWGVGRVARAVGQPRVVGEMVAGVLLGPSFFGLIWPDAHSAIFPPETLKTLYVGAQLGIGLYMFLVGLDFRLDLLGAKAKGAAYISLAGILAPFALSLPLGPWLLQTPGMFTERANVGDSILFIGAAISVTAFPVLARIIHERGLTGTTLGTLVLAAGAIDDAVAWCVLAVVLARFDGNSTLAIWTIVGCVVFLVLTLTLGRRLLRPFGESVAKEGHLSSARLGLILMLLMLAAWATDNIGVHAVFGGFILGVAMPRGLLVRELRQKLEPFTLAFLLPMFFVYSGLNTRLDILMGGQVLLMTGVVLLASFVGKGVACWAAARISGETNRQAMAVGALMNARGLMELIIVNIGLQRGIIEPTLFSMLVVMAIVTTLIASPLFECIYGRHPRQPDTPIRQPADEARV